MTRTGFKGIEITTEQLGFYLPDTTAYWQEISQTFVAGRLFSLDPTDLERFKTEHFSELKSLWTEQGIWIDIPVHFSVAKKQS